MRRRERGREKNFEISFQQQKKKRNTHRPSGNLIRPRVVDPVRARALRSPFPRDHFFITFFRTVFVCLFVFLSLSQKKKKKKTLLSFFGGKFKRKKWEKHSGTNGLKKPKNFAST